MKTPDTTRRFRVEVDAERCKGCGLCLEFCPAKALTMSSRKNKKGCLYVEFSGENCTGCLRCGLICPDVALKIIKL